MTVKALSISSFEEFMKIVLSVGHVGTDGKSGAVILEMNDDGTLKTNENNEVIILGDYPDRYNRLGRIGNVPV